VTHPPRDDGDALSRARIEQRFRTNSGLIIAARIVTACLSLVMVPIVVSRLGMTGYGTWEALLALATLSSLFQLTISGTLVWQVSEAYGRGDSSEIRRVARLGAGACLVMFVVLWPLAWLLREPAVEFLRVPPELRHTASQMFPVLAGLILLGGLSETLEAIVSGCQRTGLVNVVVAAAQALNYTVVIIIAILGGGLWSLVAGQAAGFSGRLAGAWLAARSSFGRVSLIPLVPHRGDVSMLGYSASLTVSSVASALRDQTDKIVLSAMASTTWVGYYGLAARLAGLVLEVLRPLYSPLLTAAGALKAMGDWDGVRDLYRRGMFIVSILTGLLVVVLAGLVDHLVVFWIGEPIPDVRLLLWLLIAGSGTAAILTGPGTAISRGSGQAGIEATYLAVNLVLNIALTITLVLLIGPVGTAVATGLTWALSSILFLFVLHRKMDLPADASRRAAGTALIAAATAGLLYWASSMAGLPEARQEAIGTLVLWGTAGTLLYFALLASFRLVSFRRVYGGLRALLGGAG
jgi:O-antigen/teichoic acid export membrane protein